MLVLVVRASRGAYHNRFVSRQMISRSCVTSLSIASCARRISCSSIERSPDRLVRRLAHTLSEWISHWPLRNVTRLRAPAVHHWSTRSARKVPGCWARRMRNTLRPLIGRTRTSGHRPYLEHALLIADLRVGLECAVRDHPAIAILTARDFQPRAPIAPQRAAPWTMTAKVGGTEIAVAPDKVFALQFADRNRTNYFLVEADRATMPMSVSRSRNRRSRKRCSRVIMATLRNGTRRCGASPDFVCSQSRRAANAWPR